MKLIKNLSWIFFANAFASLSKWLIVILIAKNLSATEVGIYSLAFAIGAPVTLFANMKLRSLYITSDQNNINDYFYSRNILSVLALIILIAIGLIVYPQYFMIIVLVGLAKILDLQSDLYYAIPHKNSNLNVIGKMIIVKQSLILISFSVALILSSSLFFALLIQMIIQCSFLFFVERNITLNNYEIDKNKGGLKGIKHILILGFPLGLVQMFYSINTNYPRYVLEYFENAEVLGYFAAIMYIVTVFNLLMNSISQVFLPKFSKLYISRDIMKIKKYLYFYLSSISLIVGVGVVAAAVLFGEKILVVLYGLEYANYTSVLVLISLSMAINMVSWNFDTVLMAMRYISIQPKITIANLIFTVIFGYFLISNFGIKGASYTLIISATTLLILRVYFVNKRIELAEQEAKEDSLANK